MRNNNKAAKIIGILFLFPFLAYGMGSGLITAVLDSQNLTIIADHQLQILCGALLLLLNSMAVVALGVMLFPVLETYSKRVALGYFSTRILESIVLLISLFCLLILVAVGEKRLSNNVFASVHSETLMLIARRTSFWAYHMAMILLGTGSMFFCNLLLTSGIVPKFLAVLGLVGYSFLILGSLLEISGYPYSLYCSIPGGLFELAMGLRLILKGFNPPLAAVKQEAAFRSDPLPDPA